MPVTTKQLNSLRGADIYSYSVFHNTVNKIMFKWQLVSTKKKKYIYTTTITLSLAQGQRRSDCLTR